MDYFDWLIKQLIPGQTELYRTGGARVPNRRIVRTSYIYMGIGRSRGEDAIVYSINTNRKRISRSFLNGVHHEFVITGAVPSPEWCRQHFPEAMNDGHCNYCVISSILITYQK